MVPIVRACALPAVRRVTAVLGSQMGKTEGVFNVIGHRLDDDPIPILYIGPTQKLVESVSADRFIKMLQSVPSLWERLAKGKRNKITEKFIAGVRIGFGWAGSATELSAHPAGLVFLDERDRMEAVRGEGDPGELAEGRIATFPDGKVIVVSTPTVGNVQVEKNPETGLEHWAAGEVSSPIWQLWQEGTRYEWAWPCPDCHEYFIPRFAYLTWPEEATAQEAAKKARLACPHCGSLIEEKSKARMNARGVYVAPGQRVLAGAVVGDVPATDAISFWVSGLCSPWRTFGQRARAYVTAKKSGDPARLQAVMNIQFGELYHIGGDAQDWQEIADLREGYKAGAVPDGVIVITCGVDVQKNRLVYSIRGWGYNFESWLIEHGELWGETEFDAVWLELAEMIERKFDDRPIRLTLIDSGYKPGEAARNPDNQIYNFCRRHRGRAFASKGHDTQYKPYKASKIDVSFKGKVIKNGLDLWHLDSDYFKTWVHSRLQWPRGESGAWHLNADATDDYCKQLVAEHRIVSPSGRVEWIQLRRDNHFLDCEALNAAAAHILRLHTLPKPAPAEEAEKETKAPAPNQLTVARPPRRSNWVMNFRQ